jgi:hypothetical protein
LAAAKISSVVATAQGRVHARDFTSNFTFFSFNVIVLPWKKIPKEIQLMDSFSA